MSDADLRSLIQDVSNTQARLQAEIEGLRPAVTDLSSKLPAAVASDDIQSGKRAAANLRALATVLGVTLGGSEGAQAEQWQLALKKYISRRVDELAQADVQRVVDGWQRDLQPLAGSVEALGKRLDEVQSQVEKQTKELVERLAQAEARANAAETALSEARAQLVELGAVADGLLDVADSLNGAVGEAPTPGENSP